MYKVEPSITPKDIVYGEPDSCLQCPTARALNRLLSKDFKASVASSQILIMKKRSCGNSPAEYRFDLESDVKAWILSFDNKAGDIYGEVYDDESYEVEELYGRMRSEAANPNFPQPFSFAIYGKKDELLRFFDEKFVEKEAI